MERRLPLIFVRKLGVALLDVRAVLQHGRAQVDGGGVE